MGTAVLTMPLRNYSRKVDATNRIESTLSSLDAIFRYGIQYNEALEGEHTRAETEHTTDEVRIISFGSARGTLTLIVLSMEPSSNCVPARGPWIKGYLMLTSLKGVWVQ
jgi:hypothetical protein